MLQLPDPRDADVVEGKTWISTEDQYETVPHFKAGVKGILGQWKNPKDMKAELDERFPGCMKGRTMYMIPFSMGPVGSTMSKIGILLTDSSYVLLSMRIMTKVSQKVLEVLKHGDFVKCVHSVGCPRPVKKKVTNNWPCNPEKAIIAHLPQDRVVMSYGSGYGGNSLLGKKCFALRIASVIARDEGWMAEHMLIMSVTDPAGKKKFVSAAFASESGKTNLAMINPSVPGFKVKVVGNDIAWMKFNDAGNGELRGINPEAGFFGVAPGVNSKTNPNAMLTFQKDCIFTNVAETADGGFFWEGMEDEVDKNMRMTTWLNQEWRIGSPGLAAHPNSRFMAPASQCPIIHPKWEDPAGVPISAIIFGGCRPRGVPLVVESFSWEHGVLLGACVKSEATAAGDTGKTHDPMGMQPFIGYNFGKYLQHWLDMKKPERKMPKIFHVNWFRADGDGKPLWPGLGENIRVLDWILKRCDGEVEAIKTPAGYVPKKGDFNLDGLDKPVDWEELFSLPKKYWLEDTRESRRFLEDQMGTDLPKVMSTLLDQQEKDFSDLPDK
ncbi:phosphoenolpyruvate carboxykinase [GTP]-like [Haliotis asinina]|uniref:phosphoenolpyruvate carboxykinase [GTP]-like n=1 Tax=Haliotis asinina TaxID=109174 RepID=UPI00353271DC